MQVCRQDVARSEAELQALKKKDEQLLANLRQDINDLQSKNDDQTRKLVC